MRILTTVFLLIFIGVGEVRSQSWTMHDDLAENAKEFFSVWLLRGDIDGAVGFVSSNPVLGKCMTPDYLERKRTPKRSEIIGVFRKVLDIFAKQILLSRNSAKADDLSKLISSEGTNLFDPNTIILKTHRFESYFKIFTLRPLKGPLEVAYVCKFDEHRNYRERVNHPDVYYLVTTIDFGVGTIPVTFMTLWVKEGQSWRILTLEPTDE